MVRDLGRPHRYGSDVPDELIRLRVIHGLRLRSLLEAAELARLAELDLELVDCLLEEERQQGFVVHRSGLLSGWMLTTSGRVKGERLLADNLAGRDVSPVIETVYEEFLGLDSELLSICTDWQTLIIDGIEVVNDHRDPERDRAVLDRLDALHHNSLQITQQLADALIASGDMGHGCPLRMRESSQARPSGSHDRLIDSYHNVWFELHEDLLATLGRRRVDERSR